MITFEARHPAKRGRHATTDYWRRHAKFSDWSALSANQARRVRPPVRPPTSSGVLFERFDYEKTTKKNAALVGPIPPQVATVPTAVPVRYR